MTTRSLLLVMAACGHPATSSPRTTSSSPRRVAPVDEVARAPTQHRARDVVEAAHAGMIVQLTTTPDGTAALSVDDRGSARLWSSFDGTAEPCVVELPQEPRQLALVRRDDGFAAAVRDGVGGLYVARLAADGRTQSHVTIDGEPPIAGVVASTRGFVAWRTDERVLLIDDDGRVIGNVPARAQQHIVAVTTAGDRAVALVETTVGTRLRWLMLTDELAWGAWIDTKLGPDRGVAVALAPGGREIGVLTNTDSSGRLRVVDERGRSLADDPVNKGPASLAFVSSSALAISWEDRALWLRISKISTLIPMGDAANGAVRVGKGVAVRALGGQLAFSTPTTRSYLGYAITAPLLAAAGPDDALLVAGTPGLALLGPDLRDVLASKLALPDTYNVGDVEWVGGHDFLVEYSDNGALPALALIDASSGARQVLRKELARVSFLAYEAATGLVTLSFGADAQVARLDRKAHTLDAITVDRSHGQYEDLVYAPVDPDRAGGARIVRIEISEASRARWFKGTPGKDAPVATVAFTGNYAATDAAGRVYEWLSLGPDRYELEIFAAGKKVAAIAATAPGTVWPSPDGTGFAVLTPSGLSLYRGDKLVWTREIEFGQEVHWLTSGALALVHPSGIVRLAADTGEPQARRCGWAFGVSAQPLPVTPTIDSICTQLLR